MTSPMPSGQSGRRGMYVCTDKDQLIHLSGSLINSQNEGS
jgi:hypothetical protein